MTEIGIGDSKEIMPLVATSTYSAVVVEIGLKLVSLLPSCLRVKQAQIELSRDDDRHRVVKDRIYHEYPTSVGSTLIVRDAGLFKFPSNELFKTCRHVFSSESVPPRS